MGEDADHVIGDLRSLRRPRVFIISGPSGVGKDAVIEQLRLRYPDAYYAVTATTRNRRPGEMEGYHYHFMSEEEFRARLADGDFLESATVYGNLYGVLRSGAREALARGQDVFFKVDVQGAAEIRRLLPTAVSIFLAPESAATLLQRLKHRKTDDPAVLMTRFATATRELAAAFDFDYVVFNRQDQLDQALEEMLAIIHAEKVRSTQPDSQL
ncbi:MAG: guanylate kinase [Thermomicrobiales bacterium]|nr:guanylate kinase [Thermomicrobiales bacterium]MCA9880474.1 guanylate kinase [Thermomicrobiales bacterium]